MTNIKEINYENYGSCISMSNQTIEMIVTVEKGWIQKTTVLFWDSVYAALQK